MSIEPDFPVFEQAFGSKRSQLVYRWVAADLETTVSAFLKLAGREPYSFLLESVEGGAMLGRYSAIGLAPDVVWSCENDKASVNGKEETSPPLESLRAHLAASKLDTVPDGLPPMAKSGLFGYMGYDMVRLIEDIPDDNPDTLGIPDSVLVRPTLLVMFDNVKHMVCLATPVYRHAGCSAESAQQVYQTACEKLDGALTRLAGAIDPALTESRTSLPGEPPAASNMAPGTFRDMVRKAIDYIRAGEIFQVVVGQRFTMPFDLPAFELYRALRRVNPSPFLFYLNLDDFALVGSSPEIMVRVRDHTVTIRPIAGTRPRGKTPADDRELAEDLLADPKERAEHLMLLDLGRNDVGRVAEVGSVKVTEEFEIEHYSHVMHIVSNVEGRLRPDFDAVDALFAGFPAGTVSGAPKVRAMEIIDELESVRRSYYAGCVGYLSADGDLDTCIALRTALVRNGTMTVQASGGIVADSVPEAEFEESRNKAQALIRAAREALELSRQRPGGTGP
ncbi:MAG: anthranilate synthase component I [Alphaproteobacteria bacterium]|nr:anthranilate synthase component I [Alphaproteobacteria bacterium]